MRRIAMVVVCLSALGCAQGTYSGGVNWTGGATWGGSQGGWPGGDLPLPDFTAQGGVALSLPQQWVDPQEAFGQNIDNTVYIGATSSGCPTAPARTNYKGNAKSAGQCDFYDSNGAGLTTVVNDWAALSGGGYDQRWDVAITHGASYNFGSGQWTWPAKYNGTATSKYLVFHSDCTASSPCTGTNDLGYNPRGRIVCSHGIQDYLNPPLPDMGQRNHSCAGYLGMPAVSYPAPIAPPTPSSPGPYTYDPNYNDLGNMWNLTSTSTSSSGGSVITMGAASTQGGPLNCNNANLQQAPTGGMGTGNPCPVQGINHIWIEDAHVTAIPSNAALDVFPINFKPLEWITNGNAQMPDWINAAPNHVGIEESYLDGQTDDDGFGPVKIQAFLMLTCSYCAATHFYLDGVKDDGTEDHSISLNDAPGPVLLSHFWCEGGSICLWGGGGKDNAVQKSFGHNIEERREVLTYNPRWLPPPAGIQLTNHKITGGSCSSGTLTLTWATGGGVISQTTFYLSKIKDGSSTSVVSDGWYDASSAPTCSTNCSASFNSTSCTLTPATGNVYGYTAGISVGNAAAMSAAGKVGTQNNPSAKNRDETKVGYSILKDGIICQNSGADGQTGECLNINIRAIQNAWGNGGQYNSITDLVVTNSIIRNSNIGIQMSSRSGGNTISSWPIQSVMCSSDGTQATVTSSTLNLLAPGNHLADYSNNTSVGTDVYLSAIGANGGGTGTPLIAEGWYQTQYSSNYGSSIVVYAPVSASPFYSGSNVICTTLAGTTTSGTVTGADGSNGSGVSWPLHRMVLQNNLLYGLGDHTLGNGSGGNSAYVNPTANGNNYSVTSTIQSDGVTAHAVLRAINMCPASLACPAVADALVGDLAYIQCGDMRFSTGVQGSTAGAKGSSILSVDSDQTGFTYTPQNSSSNPLVAGNSATCNLASPISSPDSGYQNNQSFPWPFHLNHLTVVGVNGQAVSYGSGRSQFNKYGTYLNTLQLIPGPSDIYANDQCAGGIGGGTCKMGFVAQSSETYSAIDATGVTNGNDRASLTMKSYALSTRNIHNYITFPCGSPSYSGCDTSGNPSTAGTNSTPSNVASGGNTVTCNSGVACDATHYIPDSIGFIGALNTHNFPFALADFRQYALDASSPYYAGGILQATDGLDNGAQIPLIINAMSRTLYPCQLPCGSGPHRDGPQYGFLEWSAYPGAVNYRVYRDGGVSPVGSVTTTWFDDYGLPSGTHTWTVKAWDGSAEHVVSGLTSQIN